MGCEITIGDRKWRIEGQGVTPLIEIPTSRTDEGQSPAEGDNSTSLNSK